MINFILIYICIACIFCYCLDLVFPSIDIATGEHGTILLTKFPTILVQCYINWLDSDDTSPGSAVDWFGTKYIETARWVLDSLIYIIMTSKRQNDGSGKICTGDNNTGRIGGTIGEMRKQAFSRITNWNENELLFYLSLLLNYGVLTSDTNNVNQILYHICIMVK